MSADRRERNFYGRRKGKPLDGRKARLTEELLPRLLLDPTAPPVADAASLFDDPVARVEMEIGFGSGEHLALRARENPDIGFIGVEPFINGMAKMLGEIDAHGLTNVRLYNDDAAILLDWLPADSLTRLDLLYPDPWPKKRHWKRRFVSLANLARIHRVLKGEATFRFASDIDTYVNWTLQHTHRSGLFAWTARRCSDWQTPWEGWLRTRYEAKAIREGRVPAYLTFVPLSDPGR